MSLNVISNGQVRDADKVMGNFNPAYRYIGQSLIQQLQDRAITFTADGGIFAEAYIDSNGRNNRVNTSETNALFDTDKYKFYQFYDVTSTGTEETSSAGGSVDLTTTAVTTNISFLADGIVTQVPIHTNTTRTVTCSVVRNGVTICQVSQSVNGQSVFTLADSDYSDYFRNGETAVVTVSATGNVQRYPANYTYSGTLYETSVQRHSGTNNFGVKALDTATEADTIITHTIPTGTFSDTISSAFVTYKAEDWESGADVQFKLTNATEDTGWLSTNQIVSFTALTAEPDTLIVKLIPKSSSPTAGHPSINGICLFAERP